MEGITGIAYSTCSTTATRPRRRRRARAGLAELPLKPSFLDTVSDSAEGAVRDARELMAAVNAILTPENRERIGATLASLEKVASNLETATAKLPRTITRR